MSSPAQVTISVRLYSILRNRNNQIVDRMELQVPEHSNVSQVLDLLEVPDDLEIILAVNDRVTEKEQVLEDGDHLAIIPAVAGGVAAG